MLYEITAEQADEALLELLPDLEAELSFQIKTRSPHGTQHYAHSTYNDGCRGPLW